MPTRTTVTGLVTNVAGNIATSGTVVFQLQPNASSIPYRVSGTSIIAPNSVIATINASGQIKAENGTDPLELWGNDTLSPAQTFYRATFFPDGEQTQTWNLLLIQGSTYDLSAPVFYENVGLVPNGSPPTFQSLDSSIIPAADGQFSLGTDQKKYASLYVNQIFSDQNTFPGQNVFDAVRINGDGLIAYEPYPGYGLAYGSFLQTYTANKPGGNEWIHEVNVDSSLSGEKVSTAVLVFQHPGSGSVWAANFVVNVDASVGLHGAQGLEVDLNNNNFNCDSPTDPQIIAFNATGAGTHRGLCAYQVSGVGQIWERGFYVDVNNSVRTSSFEDRGNATSSFEMQGVHINGINGKSGIFSASVLSMPYGVGITSFDTTATERNVIKVSGTFTEADTVNVGWAGMSNGLTSAGRLTSTLGIYSGSGRYFFETADNSHAGIFASGTSIFCRDGADTGWARLTASEILVAEDTGGGTGFTTFTNAVNLTLTNAYVVKGGQAATTPNTGWMKVYIGANSAWIPYWQNATP